jgi:hypothetical protein
MSQKLCLITDPGVTISDDLRWYGSSRRQPSVSSTPTAAIGGHGNEVRILATGRPISRAAAHGR